MVISLYYGMGYQTWYPIWSTCMNICYRDGTIKSIDVAYPSTSGVTDERLMIKRTLKCLLNRCPWGSLPHKNPNFNVHIVIQISFNCPSWLIPRNLHRFVLPLTHHPTVSIPQPVTSATTYHSGHYLSTTRHLPISNLHPHPRPMYVETHLVDTYKVDARTVRRV